MKLSEKIAYLRKKNGMSQEKLSELLNVSRQAVSRRENGTSLPDAANIVQLSKLFSVTADYLLNDDYESDYDVPLFINAKSKARQAMKNYISLCIAGFGLFGNFMIYLFSRLIEVKIPVIAYQGGEKIYQWTSLNMGRSYKYFIIAYDLEIISFLFWGMFVGGILFAVVNKIRTKKRSQKNSTTEI